MYICFKTNQLGCMKWISERGDRGGGFLPKNDFETGDLMEGRGGGLLEEKWGLILRDFTLKQQSD